MQPFIRAAFFPIMKKKLISILIFIFIAFSLHSQTKSYGILGGEVYYHIHANNMTDKSVIVERNTYFNPSKSFIMFVPFHFYNYAFGFYPLSIGKQFNNSVLCQYNYFNHPYWGNVPDTNGVYIRHYAVSDTSGYYKIPIYIPPNGWVFSFHTEHLDTSVKNIIHQSNPYLNDLDIPVIYTRLYPYTQSQLPFDDRSAIFTNDAVIFAKAGDTVTYNPGLADPDGDSITIHWNYQFGGSNPNFQDPNQWPIDSLPKPNPSFSYYPPPTYSYFDSIHYAPGYNYNNPLPDQNFNANNIPATLDTNTGEIYFCCHNPGNYSASVMVRSYRAGVRLSETVRWIFFTIFPADSNHTPVISPANQPFTDTIYAGDSVNIPFSISDGDNADWVRFKPNGFLLDSSLISSTGCAKPPCAYFTTLPPDSFHVFSAGVFHWQTSCNHVNQNQNTVTYNFVLKAKDDHCPMHAIGRNSIKITVLRPPKLPAPLLHCRSVDSAGNVLLSWTPVVDSLGRSFQKYNIYFSHSPSSGFVLINSLFNINTSSYLHIGAGANADTLYYFIKTISGCDNMFSASSDTLSTIFLELQNSGTGVANLSWNDIRDSSNLSSYYQIYRSINGGNYSLIDSSLSLTYTDTISVCSLNVSYYIAFIDSSGCSNSSNIRSDIFMDIIAPHGVVIDTVSVTNNNHPVIGWASSSSSDVNAYVIYRNGIAVDTVLNSPFEDLQSLASSTSFCYKIAALDSCKNSSPISDTHCSIRLSANANSCDSTIKLSWNANQDTVALGFEVWASLNGAAPILLQSLGVGSTSFVHSNAVVGGNYCYFIREKLSANRIASSNAVCVKADFTPSHGFAYLRLATIANSGDVNLRIFSDTLVALRYFKIEKKKLNSNTFDSIGMVLWQPSSFNFFFTDHQVQTSKYSYLYRVIAVDSCYNRDTTNIGRTIFLQSASQNNYSNRLTWNDYGNWNAGTDFYLIHRLVENVEIMPPLFIPFSASGENSYLDDISDFGTDASLFCYFIEAVENQGDSITFQSDTSFSNLSCDLRDPLIVVPNAFTPEGKNPVFKPEIPYFNGSPYSLKIFDRWGEKMFETTDINQGWDGKFKGTLVKVGVYVYQIEIIDRNGKPFVKLGSVMVLR